MNYYNEIIQNLKTVEDISLLSKELELIKQNLYKTNTNFEQIITNQIRQSTAKTIQSLLNYIQPKTHNPQPNERDRTLEDLITYINSLPKIHLTLATEPSIQLLTDISTSIRNDIDQNAILETTINPEIIGGLILDYNGKYYDYSVKKALKNSELFF